MSDWRRGSIGELAKGHRGVSYAAGQLRQFKSPETVTLLRSNNISSGRLNFEEVQIVSRRLVSEDQLMRIGDIAVCMSNGSKALVGKAAPFLGAEVEDFTVGAFCSIFRPVDVSTSAFISFIFQSKEYRKNLDLVLAGTAINNLRNADLEAFGCDIPPPHDQLKIAQILDTLDTAIHETEAIIAKLKAIKQGLLHDLLTRGIDANGELRPPQTEAPHLYKESPLGWIPREWEIESINRACSDVVDCPHSTPNYQDQGVLVARTMHIKDGAFLETQASRVSERQYQERVARLEPRTGDVIFTREAPVGEAFVISLDMRICLGQRVMLLRPKNGRLVAEYLLAQIYSGAVKDRIATLTSGTTNPHLNVSEVKEFEIPLPLFVEQQEIAKRLSEHESRLQSEISKQKKLSLLKTGLMDDLLTGRVRVTPLLEAAAP